MTREKERSPMDHIHYKAMPKSELAEHYGASMSTFRRALLPYRRALKKMGVKATAKLLPPKAVAFLCDKLCISVYKD